MSDETSSPRISGSSDKDAVSDTELGSLRKEVIEARNLVIKTDNLLKNLHAEVKKLGDRAREQETRHWMTSVTAYVIFAVMCAVGAIFVARSEVRTAREEAAQNEARARSLQQDAEKIKQADSTRREASEKALHVYEMLASEKEGPGLNQAMQQAVHLDRAQISALEARAIDDRAAGMKAAVADNALQRGQQAFRRQDWKTASTELGRYVELVNKVDDPVVWFHLGSARIQTREFPGAVQPLETFIKSTGGTKTAQYAGLLLGQALEETNQPQKAREAYERAAALYPGSDFATMIRARLRKLSQAAQATPATPAPAAAR